MFYGPGIENFDMTLEKDLRLSEARSLQFRLEAFNAFNHAQFYGPASVDGQIEDPTLARSSALRLLVWCNSPQSSRSRIEAIIYSPNMARGADNDSIWLKERRRRSLLRGHLQ
jgi:hypothetical protein